MASDIQAPYLEVTHKKSLGRVPIVEIFGPTIQGEGAMYGQKTMFIRFGGCDYRCKMCDSMHAVDQHAFKKNVTWAFPHDVVLSVTSSIPQLQVPWVTLSGGNPCMWEEVGDVVNRLHNQSAHHFKVALETQGSIWQPWVKDCDQITISPKGPGMGERFNRDDFVSFLGNLVFMDDKVAVKIVVFDQRDFEFAVEVDQLLTKEVRFAGGRYLSLGNPYPPKLNPDGTSNPAEKITGSLPVYLLDHYRSLLDDYLQDPRLSEWRFLPQLHVLVWGNEQCR